MSHRFGLNRRAILNTASMASGFACGAMVTGLLPCARAAAPSGPFFVDRWLNASATDGFGLRGKVSLVNFWTYSCINALRTLPYLRRWHEEYGPEGLQIIGIHTPEFGFEHLRANVEFAVRELDIRYAVGQDNSYRTWRAWNNRAWPAFYILDRNARSIMIREGEGHAVDLELAIRMLLGKSPEAAHREPPDDADLSRIRSPEAYFGASRPTRQEPHQSPRGGDAVYSFSERGPQLNRYELEGRWARGEEALTLRSAVGRVRMRFSAARLFLVASAPQGAQLRIGLGDGARRDLRVERPQLYTIVDGETYGEHLLELEVQTAGFSLYSATFG